MKDPLTTDQSDVFKVQGIPVVQYFPRQAIRLTLLCEADLSYGEALDLLDWIKDRLL